MVSSVKNNRLQNRSGSNFRTKHNLLPSLAIVKVNWDRKKEDYIDNFVPFIVESLRLSTSNSKTLIELKESIHDLFGFDLPENALKTILHRAKESGYGTFNNGQFIRSEKCISSLDFNRDQSNVLRSYKSLIDKFIDFSSKKSQIEIEYSKAEEILTSYIKEIAVPILAAAIESSGIPRYKKSNSEEHYLIHAFIVHLYQKDQQGFEFLETVVKGSMLASALNFPLGDLNRKFKNTGIYFDTGFLLHALGFAGEHLQSPCIELIDLLLDAGAELYCFEHTIEELRGILDRASHLLRTSSISKIKAIHLDILDHIVNSNKNPSDIEYDISKLEESLIKLKIRVKITPAYNVNIHSLDEHSLENEIKNIMNYRNPRALIRDIDSISSIHRLRQGKKYSHIEECKAIFVTENPKLAKASMSFAKKESLTNIIPFCVLDHELATLMWLKNPDLHPELPQSKIIADCYAAMNPSIQLWKAYLDEIQKLSMRGDLSDSDCHKLIYSMETRTALMEKTYGSVNDVGKDTIISLLMDENQKKTDLFELSSLNQKLENEVNSERQKRIKTEHELNITKKQFSRLHSAFQKAFRLISILPILVLDLFALIFVAALFGCSVFLNLSPEQQRLFDFTPNNTIVLIAAILMGIVFISSIYFR